VWVWGFWFGFALRRVALLCGEFVQWHLALFPAGGPFLPSLSVNSIFMLAPRSKRCAYRQMSSALHFVPMLVESFGRFGALALTLLGDLADKVVQAGRPGLSRATFIAGALRELSVARCRCNASLCRSGAHVTMRASGRTPTAQNCPAVGRGG
jgi:hypothetical protein